MYQKQSESISFLNESSSLGNNINSSNSNKSDNDSTSSSMFNLINPVKSLISRNLASNNSSASSSINPATSNVEAQGVLNSWFSQAESDSCLSGLSRRQRAIGFFLCLLLGSLFISLSLVLLPFQRPL